MRLLNVQTLQLQDFDDAQAPEFATLSCCWAQDSGPEDVSAVPLVISHRGKDIAISPPIVQALGKARDAGLLFLWAYAICVDQASSVEQEEAVNSLFRLFQQSAICIVYLDDLPAGAALSTWGQCRWWTRSWTLQELIAPRHVAFFDSTWTHCGDKKAILGLVSSITGVDKRVLSDSSALSEISIGTRMSWAAKRSASRVEDQAYALVGIFGVSMRVQYGEGKRAFLRLQEEILHDCRDGSIFAWHGPQEFRGLLARSPCEFDHFSSNPAWQEPWQFDGEVNFSSKGIKISSRFSSSGPYLHLSIGRLHGTSLGIDLLEQYGAFVRVNKGIMMVSSGQMWEGKIHVSRDVDRRISDKISKELSVAKAGAAELGQVQFRGFSTRHHDNVIWPVRKYVVGRFPPTSIHTDPNTSIGMESRGEPDQEVATKNETTNHQVTHGKRAHDSSSESTEDESCSDADDDDDTEGDSQYSSSEYMFPGDITNDPELNRTKTALAQMSYQSFQAWRATARYIRPPAVRPRTPMQKRTRTGSLVEDTIPEHADYIIISRVDGYFHFACPFYAFDPVDHVQCLKHGLHSIRDVTRHVWQHHRRAPYCPICKTTFKSMPERDDHIRAQTCELRNLKLGGITEDQRAKLSKPDDLAWSEDDRWREVFRIVLPHIREIPRSPYLEGQELQISMLQDFWSREGNKCISNYLTVDNTVGTSISAQDGGAVAALYKLVIRDMVNTLLKELDVRQEPVRLSVPGS
jgi:hypothetical protein